MTPDTPQSQDDIMTAWTALIEEGLGILHEEREVFMKGRYEALDRITADKLAMMARLEDALPIVPRNAVSLRALERLVKASKRNEEVIAAARQGLSYAKLRIRELSDTRRGAVAYAEDGSRIESRADTITESTSL